jgi:hypothetical protein
MTFDDLLKLPSYDPSVKQCLISENGVLRWVKVEAAK